MLAIGMAAITACSHNDEPPVDKQFAFPALNEIGDNRIWTAQEITYVASTGQELKPEELLIAGANLGLTLEISEATLKEHFTSNAYANQWATCLYSYTFDRDNGYIYISGNETPFAQIISYDLEKQEIILHCHYDIYVTKGILPGYVMDDTRPDIGSYARMVMKPETNTYVLEEIAATDLLYDYRK